MSEIIVFAKIYDTKTNKLLKHAVYWFKDKTLVRQLLSTKMRWEFPGKKCKIDYYDWII